MHAFVYIAIPVTNDILAKKHTPAFTQKLFFVITKKILVETLFYIFKIENNEFNKQSLRDVPKNSCSDNLQNNSGNRVFFLF